MAAATVRGLARLAAPVLYGAALAPVFLSVIAALSYLEHSIWLSDLTGLYYNGDIVAAVTLLLVGGLVFGLLGRILLRLERPARPTVLDHVRHCALLYGASAYLGCVLLANHESQAGGLGHAVGIATLLVAAYAVLIDALVISRQRRRLGRTDAGGGA